MFARSSLRNSRSFHSASDCGSAARSPTEAGGGASDTTWMLPPMMAAARSLDPITSPACSSGTRQEITLSPKMNRRSARRCTRPFSAPYAEIKKPNLRTAGECFRKELRPTELMRKLLETTSRREVRIGNHYRSGFSGLFRFAATADRRSRSAPWEDPDSAAPGAGRWPGGRSRRDRPTRPE